MGEICRVLRNVEKAQTSSEVVFGPFSRRASDMYRCACVNAVLCPLLVVELFAISEGRTSVSGEPGDVRKTIMSCFLLQSSPLAAPSSLSNVLTFALSLPVR